MPRVSDFGLELTCSEMKMSPFIRRAMATRSPSMMKRSSSRVITTR